MPLLLAKCLVLHCSNKIPQWVYLYEKCPFSVASEMRDLGVTGIAVRISGIKIQILGLLLLKHIMLPMSSGQGNETCWSCLHNFCLACAELLTHVMKALFEV